MDWIHLLQDILVIILQLQVAETILSLLKQKRKKKKEKGKKGGEFVLFVQGWNPGLQTELGKEFSGSTPRDQMQGVRDLPRKPSQF